MKRTIQYEARRRFSAEFKAKIALEAIRGYRTRWTPTSALPPSRGDRTHGRPDIFNADRGSQFTSFAFTATLKDVGPRQDRLRPLDYVAVLARNLLKFANPNSA